MLVDASEARICAVAYLCLQPKEYSADLAFVIEKCRVAPMRHISIAPQVCVTFYLFQ